MKIATKLWIGLGVLVFCTPLGIILPARFRAGSAWGEWSGAELTHMLGYLPAGFARAADLWKPPLAHYALPGQANASLETMSASYVLSGILGVAAVVGVTLLYGRLIARRGDPDPS